MKTRLILILASLLCAAILRAQTATVTFRVPIEIAAHYFSVNQYVFNPETNLTEPVGRTVTYAGLNDPNFGAGTYLEFTAEITTDENSHAFWLVDSLTGAESEHFEVTPLNPLIVSPTWYDSSGHPNTFFAISSLREYHTLCLKSNTGIVFPVQASAPLYLDVPDGQGGTTPLYYALSNAWAQVPSNEYYGTSFQLLDLTAAQSAPVDTANLANPAVSWTPLSGGLPTVVVRILLGNAEAGNSFVLHPSGGALQSLSTASVTVAGVARVAVEGTAGLGGSVTLVRSDGVSSPTVALAQSGNVLDWSGYFPADYMPTWASTQFRAGGWRAGHTFTVRHANGVQVPLSFPATPTGHVSIPNSAGQVSDRAFFEAYVDVDQKQDWILFDESYSQNLGRVTSAGDGPEAWHVAPPEGKVSLNIPNWRKGHTLVLEQYGVNSPVSVEADYTAAGTFLTGTRYSQQDTPTPRTYSFQFVPALASGNPTQPFTVRDVTAGDAFDCGISERSPAEWYGPPELLTLTLNQSRWSHELYLRHFDGTQFPVQRRNLQGGWFLNAQGQGVFSSFGVFDGLSWHHTLIDFAVFDRTTSEMAGTNATELANWGTNNTDTDGDGWSDWYELLHGTIPVVWDTDGDGVRDGLDAFPLDPTRSAWGPNPSDHTPPVITLTAPAGGTLTP